MDPQTRKSSMQKINLSDGSAEQIQIDNENFDRHLAISPDGIVNYPRCNYQKIGGALYYSL